MATSQSYATQAGPCSTHYFAGGDAANWCVVTPPKWARSVTVKNRGTGAMYVAINGSTAVTGAASATGATSCLIASGAAMTFALVGKGWGVAPVGFSVFGADGATHAMDFVFDAEVA